eukprot:1423664-Amphidinium_carterae.1
MQPMNTNKMNLKNCCGTRGVKGGKLVTLFCGGGAMQLQITIGAHCCIAMPATMQEAPPAY